MTGKLAVAEAARFIERRYGGRATGLVPLGAGEWSQAYAFSLDGREMVVRFGAYGEDFEKDRRMARHASAVLPIPEVVETGAAPGGFCAVSRRAHGRFLDELDAEAMLAVLPALLNALDAARSIDLSATTGYGPWRPEGSAPHRSWPEALLASLHDRPGRRTYGWRQALAASPTGTGGFDAAAEALRELATHCPERREIIHSDLLCRNVLVRDSAVTAVLDWGNSLYGDGLYDLAWLLYWWPWYPAWRDIDIRKLIASHLAAQQGQIPDLDQRLLCYQIHIGLDAQTYTAFTGRFDDLAANAERTLALLHY
jgi:hygromycin-B 4-O-kinase